jgi:hypothetical protein
MAHLVGHSSGVQYIQTLNPATADGSVSVGGPTTTATSSGTGTNIIDGTPVRVGVLAFAAAAGLWAFKMAGLRFNVGVSA